MASFKVLRQHQGDKPYLPGETREAAASEVAHLVAKGVLDPIQTKAEPAVTNKAEKPARNKASK